MSKNEDRNLRKVHSDSQTENSIEGQIRECKAFAERSGMTILNTYIDRAFSAKTDNRPEFQKMIKDSAKGLFDVILVWKLERFARNRYDSAHNKAILRKNGVKVVSATEPISEDSTGILLESLLEGYAEFYSAELSEKVLRGPTENALKCKYNGAGIPVGYFIDDEQHFQVNEATAPLVVDYITDTALDLQGRENTNLPMLREQLAETEKSIENILNAIQSGIFNQSTKRRLDKLEQAKSDLEIRILQEEIQKPLMTQEQLTFFLHKFRDIDITNQEQRQRLIDIFVNAIYLYDDKIVFTFNNKDSAKTVSLQDIEGSDLGRSCAPAA